MRTKTEYHHIGTEAKKMQSDLETYQQRVLDSHTIW